MKEKEEKKLFPAQEKSELVLDIIRKHWFSYLIFWFLAVLMLAPLFVGISLWSSGIITISPLWESILILLVPTYLLLILGLLIYGFVDFYLDVYIVTDRRIVDIAQNGLFKRTISELNLRQIQDVKATVTGIAPTLLHFGDVNIQTAGDKPNFVFQSIPHPYEISKKILDLHEAYLQQMEKKGKQGTLKARIIDEEASPDESLPEDVSKTLTEKWFEEGSEFCYSDESCRQKLLEGVNKHLAKEKSAAFAKDEASVLAGTSSDRGIPTSEEMRGKIKDKEGELKEGKEVEL